MGFVSKGSNQYNLNFLIGEDIVIHVDFRDKRIIIVAPEELKIVKQYSQHGDNLEPILKYPTLSKEIRSEAEA